MKFFAILFVPLSFLFAPLLEVENKTFNRQRTFDVQHYSVKLSFDQKRRMVFGEATITLRPLNDKLDTVLLDAKDINFKQVRHGTSSVELPFTLDGGQIRIRLDRPYKTDESIHIALKYSAKPKKGVYFIKQKRKDGKVIRSEQIWTQGESEETRHWLPSFDFPDDKATSETIITVKDGFTVIGNGKLVSTRKNRNGTTTFHHQMPVPHSLYLTSFVVGKYEKVTEVYNGIPLSYYVYPGQSSIVPKAYGKTKEMLRIFESLTGMKFPYNKYDQTMVADFQFGGMENITATTMADSEIMMAQFEFAEGIVEDLVSHELAHSWFGNLVTCRNWAELWLNESFASFMEAAYREKMYGRKDYIRKIRDDANSYFIYSSGLNSNKHGLFNTMADAKNDDTMFDTITYQKGSAVVHTLREEIGDAAFWKAINTYLNRHKFANVETHDLKKVMEEESGRNLDWFFKQWVYSEGFPKIDIRQSYDRKTKSLNLRFLQTHRADKDTPSAFVLPLDLEIRIGNGVVRDRVVLRSRDENFSIKTDGKPELVIIDKNSRIPLKLVTLSELHFVK